MGKDADGIEDCRWVAVPLESFCHGSGGGG